ncbi:MAG: cob(I)yrinic acid a,c-diamide adenosyltransferase [Oscillospiraceae bacterium]
MKGLIHIYCGDGKGKTTAAMGLAVRAAGSGMKVVLTQFMKGDNSSEISIIEKIENISLIFCKKNFGFVWNMTEDEKKEAAQGYSEQFEQAVKLAVETDADMLVMDEFMSCYGYGFIDNKRALEFLKNKPEKLEIVLTGRNPAAELCEVADYITEMKKIKHPFDNGVGARKGIEG